MYDNKKLAKMTQRWTFKSYIKTPVGYDIKQDKVDVASETHENQVRAVLNWRFGTEWDRRSLKKGKVFK